MKLKSRQWAQNNPKWKRKNRKKYNIIKMVDRNPDTPIIALNVKDQKKFFFSEKKQVSIHYLQETQYMWRLLVLFLLFWDGCLSLGWFQVPGLNHSSCFSFHSSRNRHAQMSNLNVKTQIRWTRKNEKKVSCWTGEILKPGSLAGQRPLRTDSVVWLIWVNGLWSLMEDIFSKCLHT